MRISIVGLGEVGTYYAKYRSQSGHELVFTYFRDREKAEVLAALSEFPGPFFGMPFTTVEPASEALQQARNIV